LKTNIETREKILTEKTNYDKEEMRERYLALDALIKNEF